MRRMMYAVPLLISLALLAGCGLDGGPEKDDINKQYDEAIGSVNAHCLALRGKDEAKQVETRIEIDKQLADYDLTRADYLDGGYGGAPHSSNSVPIMPSAEQLIATYC